jgi:capsular polysaccharide biosynthesis protein
VAATDHGCRNRPARCGNVDSIAVGGDLTEEAGLVTLRDYVLIVARSWIVVAVTVAVGLVVAGILALTATPMYSSSAQVLFTAHAPTGGQDLAYAGNYVQSRMQTYKNLGSSGNLLLTVTKDLGSDETPDELAARIKVEVSQLNTVVTISAKDTTAKGAARTANTVASALLDSVRTLEGENAFDPDPGQQGDEATVQGVVAGEAVAPSSPSEPNTLLFLVAGALIGLLVSVGVVALREVLSGRPQSSTAGPSS